MFKVKRLVLTYLSFTLTFLVLSCGKENQTNSKLQEIIGENDLLPINDTSETEHITKAMGMMDIGCTVTHIGQGFAITAGHCFYPFKFASEAIDEECASDKYNIKWGVTVDNPGYLESSCVRIIHSEHNSLKDYALIIVDPIPDFQLTVNTRYNPRKYQAITIFSFPQKRPLEWSGWCSIDDKIPSSEQHQFSYECDTQGGSSGAAVLNENLEIVGIHNFYSYELNRNGATFIHKTTIPNYIQEYALF